MMTGCSFQIKGSYYDQEPKNYAYVISVPNNAGDNIEIDAKKGQTQYTTGVQLNYPLLLSAQRQWNISGGVDYLDKSYDYRYQVKRNGQIITIPGLTEDTLNTRYTAGEINLTGQRIYSQSNWALRFNLRQGLGGSSDIKLPETDIRFTRWRFGADAGYFFTPKWRISTSIDGVWSDSHLPEPEKASYGGLRFGRGYPEGEISGDYGYGGQVELRYLQPIDARWVKTVQPYVVVDTGHTFNNSHYYRNRQIASYALGATFADNRHYSLSLEGARPIAELPSDVDKRDWRLNFSFSYNFGAP
jgi:hemolysin activation/secretion protein